jgi:DNA mismatch endonuclease (patch repair protein)
MRGVRREHTKPERKVRQIAHSLGFRFRLHRKDLPGSPDLVFPRHKKVIFVHGCFWHGHAGCRYATVPKTRTDWWIAKVEKNRERDARAIARLLDLGWVPTTVWECETRKSDGLAERIDAFLKRSLDLGGDVGEGSPGCDEDEACR